MKPVNSLGQYECVQDLYGVLRLKPSWKKPRAVPPIGGSAEVPEYRIHAEMV
jgi:hypothetical protein